MYLYASEKNMEELASYEKLEGYVAITYISSTGVRLRKWADFQADNVVKSVYVGDKVQVKARLRERTENLLILQIKDFILRQTFSI